MTLIQLGSVGKSFSPGLMINNAAVLLFLSSFMLFCQTKTRQPARLLCAAFVFPVVLHSPGREGLHSPAEMLVRLETRRQFNCAAPDGCMRVEGKIVQEAKHFLISLIVSSLTPLLDRACVRARASEVGLKEAQSLSPLMARSNKNKAIQILK